MWADNSLDSKRINRWSNTPYESAKRNSGLRIFLSGLWRSWPFRLQRDFDRGAVEGFCLLLEAWSTYECKNQHPVSIWPQSKRIL
jgi:hypothetical protein